MEADAGGLEPVVFMVFSTRDEPRLPLGPSELGPPKRMPIRLDKLVSERFGMSRRAAQDAVRNGRIDVEVDLAPSRGGRWSRARTSASSRPSQGRKVAGRLRILHEDRHVLIVDKPAGLLTLPTPDRESDTLIERAGRYLAIRHGGSRPFVGVVHRLDKGTSGALALARSPEAVRAFQALFKAHDIERQYLAVVEGTVPMASGTIDRALVTDRGDLRRGVARAPGEGRPAVTHYRVVERFGTVATLVACWLETGRTHQIRIHMAEIGFPVVGDPVYRPRNHPRSKAQFHRQALARPERSVFRHPLSEQE
jgi:23S rRNA pseudouridine1911/1915/1917 synthase